MMLRRTARSLRTVTKHSGLTKFGSRLSQGFKSRLGRRFDNRRPMLRMHPLLSVNLGVLFLLVVLRGLGTFESWELTIFDRAIRRHSPDTIDPRLAIVAVTEADLRRYQWPLSDEMLASIMTALRPHSPRVIGLDLYRDLPVGVGYQELQARLAAENTIVIRNLTTPTPPPPNVPSNRIGFNDILLDRDGVIRRNLLFANDADGEPIFSFALRLTLKYLQREGIDPQNDPRYPEGVRLGETTLIPLSATAGGYHHIDNSGYQILLDYRAPRQGFRQISVSDLLDGNFDPQWLRDRIVMIGSVAPSLRDVFITPFSEIATDSQYIKMPGVVVHGQMVQQLLAVALGEQSPWRVVPNWLEFLWGVLWISAATGLTWRIRRPLPLLAGLVGVLGGLVVTESLLFTASVWMPGAWVRAGVLLGATATLGYRLLDEVLHDRLTGLPNRALLSNQLVWWRRCHRRDGRQLGAIVLDLHRFRAVNDCLGYATGDRLLVEVTERLRTCLKPQDGLARIGADEFAIFLDGVPDLHAVGITARQVRRKLRRPFVLENGQPIFLTSSIGIAVGTADSSRDPIEEASTAMHRAKALQLSSPEAFDPDFQTQAVERFRLELDLRESMTHSQVYATPVEHPHTHYKENSTLPHSQLGDRFRVHYQPLVCLASGRITGFEALVRWQHPQRGIVSPAEFIPVAEETGAIVALGAWVLGQACAQMQAWQHQFQDLSRGIVSVNLSPRQLQAPHLVDHLQEILTLTQLDPQCLKLEITESTMMEEVDVTLAVLHHLKSLNVKLGIDDFGTGYSSLSYLNRFPIDTLKIDRSFVQRLDTTPQDRAIVKTIIELTHTLGLDAIAEGIENTAQLASLRDLNCDIGQGYWFAKPLPAEAATQLLTRQPQW